MFCCLNANLEQALARVVYSRPSIVILDDVLSALDAKTEANVADQLLGQDGIFRKLGTTVILITHATQHLPLADQIFVLADSNIAEQGTWKDLRSSTGYISKLQVKEAGGASSYNPTSEKSLTIPGTGPPSQTDIQDLTRKVGDWSVYSYYFKAVGMPAMVLFMSLNASSSLFAILTQPILRAWSEAGGRDIWFYISMYTLFSTLGFASVCGAIWCALLQVAPRAGKVLHSRLLKTIMRAPLSYFATTDTGITVNRFSQDISLIDMSLPIALLVVVMYFFQLIAEFVLLFITQASITLIAPPMLIILYFLQKFYLYTSRQMRFLDIESRSTVYTNFLETLEGMSTIRAFGWQLQSVYENIAHLDVSQVPNYMMGIIQQWLSVVLDMLVAGLAVVVVSLAVGLRATTTGGQIGIALNVIVGMNRTLSALLRQWTSLETSLGSIARIKTLEETLMPENKEGEKFEPNKAWPAKGTIEFRDVTAAYNPEAIALKQVTFNILSGQKVGICGRTGSGKSTLLLAILRLIELDAGSIFIDGVDLSTIPRETLRSRLIAIPQETFVLNESVRLNIDPSGTVSDEQIIATLEKVQLWSVIKSRRSNAAPPADRQTAEEPKEEVDPLATLLKESPFSHGQFQLFGLGRALLLKNRSTILLLDEATSNVDTVTDTLMQRIIREEFATHTILSIAHRLDTIRDADVVIVLNQGKVVEVGTPGELLQKVDGGEGDAAGDEGRAWFKEMWKGAH